jgi:hypothetical protein
MKLPKWSCIAAGRCAEPMGFGPTMTNVSSARSQNSSASSGLNNADPSNLGLSPADQREQAQPRHVI